MSSPRTPENNVSPPPLPRVVKKQQHPISPSDLAQEKITNYVQGILDDVMIDYQVLLILCGRILFITCRQT